MRLSANLGLLWKELPLPDRIRAAARAGFDAVEMHDDWRFAAPQAIRAALDETGLPLVGLNTAMGETFGLAALPGREDEARAAIVSAMEAAAAFGAAAVHVTAGIAQGEAARAAYRANLAFALRHAPPGVAVLVEPISAPPGYFLGSPAEADATLAALPGLRLMFDGYHFAAFGLDVAAEFAARRERIGHVQFAGFPGRAEPDTGETGWAALLPALRWDGCFGAEYRPAGATEAGLGWMAKLRAAG